MPRHREDLGARALLGSNGGVPVGTPVHDGRQCREGLDVVDEGGAVVQPGHGRVWRLEPGLPALALEALEQRGLLATDVGTGTAVQRDVEWCTGAKGVWPEAPGRAALRDGALEDIPLVAVLAPHVDVRPLAAHAIRRDGHALNELEGVLVENLAVLEGAGLALVGVAHHVGGLAGVLGEKRRLAAHGEPGPAAAAKARAVECVQGIVGGHLKRGLEAIPATRTLVAA